MTMLSGGRLETGDGAREDYRHFYMLKAVTTKQRESIAGNGLLLSIVGRFSSFRNTGHAGNKCYKHHVIARRRS